MINGNLKGIKDFIKKRIEELDGKKFDSFKFVDEELAQELAEITNYLNKELCVYLSRSGEILYINLGEEDRASLINISLRRSNSRLSGLRCIHTHPGGNGHLSQVDIESLKKLRFDAMCAIGVNEFGPTNISMAVLSDNEQGYEYYSSLNIQKVPQDAWMNVIYEADKIIKHETILEQDTEKERALLIGNDKDSLDELERLTDTAGGETVFKAVQKSAKGLIGKGKINELALVVQSKNVDIAIYDDELTASEANMLEKELGVPIIDRTQLILDIFAMRAATKEGKMQVELAQLQYKLTRLKGEGLALSRQGGGIGTRGPGEEKLETDRRHINRRIYELKSQLSALSQRRGLMRKQRKKQDLPQIALVGYTNAGKSTLLKALSGSEVFCEDKLFATLDPLTRRCELDKGVEVLITDTVGFIKKLPHQLVEAFRSTLEETVFADILLHVCDGSSDELYQQMAAVEGVLNQIGASNIPTICVVNKVDAIDGEEQPVKDGVYVSAKEGLGLENLKKAILEEIKKMRQEATVTVPYARGDILAYIHSKCKIISEEYGENGTKVVFCAPNEEINRIISKLK
ncbi:MAG: GTPase HflX [Clostridiales bacterium]|nr:GTPase HflX [Clostridiales bacterium]